MPPVAAAFAAVAAGTATISAVATVVSTVGMGLSVVGKITGNEALMKIGGTMAMVGGVTSLASGAISAIGSATSAAEGIGAAEGALDLAGQEVGATAYSGADPSPMFSGAGEAATTGMDAANIGDVAANAQSSPAFSDARFESQRGLLDSSPAAPTEAASNSAAASMPDQQPNEWNKLVSQNDRVPVGSDTNALQKWWGALDDKTKNTVMNMGGQAVGGLFNGWNEEQKRAFEREKYNLFNSNANAQPTVSYKQVAGARPVGGLLNARAA